MLEAQVAMNFYSQRRIRLVLYRRVLCAKETSVIFCGCGVIQSSGQRGSAHTLTLAL